MKDGWSSVFQNLLFLCFFCSMLICQLLIGGQKCLGFCHHRVKFILLQSQFRWLIFAIASHTSDISFLKIDAPVHATDGDKRRPKKQIIDKFMFYKVLLANDWVERKRRGNLISKKAWNNFINCTTSYKLPTTHTSKDKMMDAFGNQLLLPSPYFQFS